MADPTEVRITSSTGGQKGSKLCRMDLIPAVPLWMLGEIYGLGAQKYAEHNWERGYDWSLSLAAALRHINRWQQGEIMDEDGFHHLTAAVFHLFALQYFEIHHPDFDNVHPKVSSADDEAGDLGSSVIKAMESIVSAQIAHTAAATLVDGRPGIVSGPDELGAPPPPDPIPTYPGGQRRRDW